MNEPIETDKDGNALTILDTVATEDNIADMLDNKIRSEQLHRYVIETLEPRERVIVVLRYGLSGAKPLPQREVAYKLGISRSYVSRIEKKALEKLKVRFEQAENQMSKK